MSKLLIIVLLVGLLFVLYKYHDTIFQRFNNLPERENNKASVIRAKDKKKITIDNVSQISASSLEERKYSPGVIDSEENIRSLLSEDSFFSMR